VTTIKLDYCTLIFPVLLLFHGMKWIQFNKVEKKEDEMDAALKSIWHGLKSIIP
jgi:hypothetical protein